MKNGHFDEVLQLLVHLFPQVNQYIKEGKTTMIGTIITKYQWLNKCYDL